MQTKTAPDLWVLAYDAALAAADQGGPSNVTLPAATLPLADARELLKLFEPEADA